MTIGQWVGQWFGEWFGSGEPAPAGAMSGTAAVALSTAGTATGKGALEGAASVILHSSGDLTVAASGMMSGVATIGVGATGALSSTSTPVTTSDYPFFSKGFWSAGFFSAGFWGSSVQPGVIARPYVEQEFITTREAWLAVHTRRDEIPIYTDQDSHLVFSGVDRFDVIDRPVHEARQEPVRRSRLAAHEDRDVSILTVPLRFQMKTIQESLFAQTRKQEGVVQDAEESVVVRDLGQERFTVRQSDVLEMN